MAPAALDTEPQTPGAGGHRAAGDGTEKRIHFKEGNKMLDFLRTHRGLYLLATAFVLLVQIPMTLIEIPRIGTERYKREIREGIKGAFRVAWNG